MCCLYLGIFHPLLLCYGTFTHYFSPALLQRCRPRCCSKATPLAGCSQNTHTHSPRSANCTVLSACHSKVPPLQPPTPRRHHHPIMSQALRRVGWEDGTTPGGRGHKRWSRGSATLTPRATVVTHSLTRNHQGPRQALTHTATSQSVMKKKNVLLRRFKFSNKRESIPGQVSIPVGGWLEVNRKLVSGCNVGCNLSNRCKFNFTCRWLTGSQQSPACSSQVRKQTSFPVESDANRLALMCSAMLVSVAGQEQA